MVKNLTQRLRAFIEFLASMLISLLPDYDPSKSKEPSNQDNLITWLLLSLFVALWIYAGPPNGP